MADLFQVERIASNKIKWREEQRQKIVELYENGYSIRKICEMFGGLHKNTIKKVLEDNNIQLRTLAQSHYTDKRNDAIFHNIDSEEKAYWLGFLAADGCVSGNYIIISLQARDEHHLEKFRNFLGASSVTIQKFKKADTKGQMRDYARFSIGCKQMAEDLKALGIIEKKSLILKPPTGIIPEKFYYDWIRGYFDGDGGISYSEKDNRWQSYVCSTKEVLDWIADILELNTKPYQEKHHNVFNNVWVLHFTGRINIYKVWNKMFHDNHATIYLDRKYKKYLQLRSSFK